MTELAIWNRALSLVGAPRISSITEVSSQKTHVDDHYPSVTRQFCCMHPWDGCTTVVDLDPASPAVLPGRWGKAWTLPADFEMAWRLTDSAKDILASPEWEILVLDETPYAKFLFTDIGPAKLEYSFDPNTDALVDLLSGTAQAGLVYTLAIPLARAWGKKESDIRILQGETQEVLYEARLANGRQQKKKAARERPLIDIRRARF